VISYLANYYFITENKEIKNSITKLIESILYYSQNDKYLRDLLFSGFFESFAFDNKEKLVIFIDKLSINAQNIIKLNINYS
jgi:hypothetical protein